MLRWEVCGEVAVLQNGHNCPPPGFFSAQDNSRVLLGLLGVIRIALDRIVRRSVVNRCFPIRIPLLVNLAHYCDIVVNSSLVIR